MNAFIHPELRNGEVFFTNSDKASFGKMSWKTKRLGAQAYNGVGEKIQHEDWCPVFLQESEMRKLNESLAEVRREFRQISHAK